MVAPGPRDEQRGSESPFAVLYGLFVSKESGVRDRASRMQEIACYYAQSMRGLKEMTNQSQPQLSTSPHVPPISRCETMLCWEMLLGRRLIISREKRFWCSSLGGGGGACSNCTPRWLELFEMLISLGTYRREVGVLGVCCCCCCCCKKLGGRLWRG